MGAILLCSRRKLTPTRCASFSLSAGLVLKTPLLQTRVLLPKSHQLTPQTNRSAYLEAANAWREAAGAREEAGAAPGAVAEAARASAGLYVGFLSLLGGGGGGGGGKAAGGGGADAAADAAAAPDAQAAGGDKEMAAAAAAAKGAAGVVSALPEGLHADDEPHALRAAFHAGCMLHAAARAEEGAGGIGTAAAAAAAGKLGRSGAGGAAGGDSSLSAQPLLRWFAAYVGRRQGQLSEDFAQEAALAAELADLLDQRAALLMSAAGVAATGPRRRGA